MKRGDVYLCDLGPVVIISADEFNRRTGIPIVLPITTGGVQSEGVGFAFELQEGLKTVGVIRCDQPQGLDIAAHKGCFIEALPQKLLADVIERVLALLD